MQHTRLDVRFYENPPRVYKGQPDIHWILKWERRKFYEKQDGPMIFDQSVLEASEPSRVVWEQGRQAVILSTDAPYPVYHIIFPESHAPPSSQKI